MKWPVMSLCEAQLLDINQDDILCEGLYRKCNTYKGGGGYDKFPEIYQRRFGACENLNNQFVVQLRGCSLDCPYCYVTRKGVWHGKCHHVTTESMIEVFHRSGCGVFHLMGGAPAIYIENWVDVLNQLGDEVFHSDLLLVESAYKPKIIKKLAQFDRSLYAVSIKGSTDEEFFQNTRTKFDRALFWNNLDLIVSSGLPFYFTYTGMSSQSIDSFGDAVISRYGDLSLLDDQFSIRILHYNALNYGR